MFRGGSTVNLDAKGRLALPTRYRAPITEQYEGHLVLTVHGDGCLLLYPQPEWDDIERKLTRLPNQDPRTRGLVRMLIGHATDVELDAHGRILIAPRLREFAKLDKRVSLAGVGNKFEIWDEAIWDQKSKTWLAEEVGTDNMPDPFASLTL
ncbi:MAG: division/cell wall cluster transcriptional repressor MraZ [Gammaproteobacteria bacterium]